MIFRLYLPAGLGVHLSFVRSISMDKWKEQEISKMKVGGNQKAREFFEEEEDGTSVYLRFF
jgi:ADP-ribosylation factor GTPase-activating protein 1